MEKFILLLCLFAPHWSISQPCSNGVIPCSVYFSQTNGPSVQTPNGTSVFTLTSQALAPCEVATGNQEFNSVNGVTSLDCPTSSYNCHGYAWYSQFNGSGQTTWIESNQISKYWTDGSFYEVPFQPVNKKAVVVYSNNNHSAVTVPGSSPTKFRSKWGAGHLVEHAPNDVPTPYGTPSRYYLLCGVCDAAPNMYRMTYNLGTANTVNFVPAGGYNLYTNLHPCELGGDLSWSSSGNNWGSQGTKKTSAWLNLSSGQSLTLAITAQSTTCGSSSRNVTFVAQSGYRMYSTGEVYDRLTIEFDNTDYLEILPQQILIYDERSGKEELAFSMKEVFGSKGFTEGKKLELDVSHLPRGTKIVNFLYVKLDSEAAQANVNKGLLTELERKTDRIILK